MTHSYLRNHSCVRVPWTMVCGRKYYFRAQVRCASLYVCVRQTERLRDRETVSVSESESENENESEMRIHRCVYI